MPITYENQYGKVILEPTEYVIVRTIRTPAKDYLFSIETAEKIALITENRRIQIIMTGHEFSATDVLYHDFHSFYVVHHESCSIASICKVIYLDYLPDRAANELISETNQVYSDNLLWSHI